MHERHRKFFVVDDDDAVRSALCLLVHSFGWEARGFASAELCLAALQDERPDCLLLDLNMPGMTGLQLQKDLIERGVVIPVIAMTGNAESSLSNRARAAGAVAVLAKPFGAEAFKASAERAIAG